MLSVFAIGWERRPLDSQNPRNPIDSGDVYPHFLKPKPELCIRCQSAPLEKIHQNLELHDWRSYIVLGKLEKHWQLRRLYNSVNFVNLFPRGVCS